MMRTLRFLFSLGVATLFITQSSTYANTQAGLPFFFSETGHTLAYSFRQFYEQQGGLPIFGLPITEVYLEDGRPVQYFERARFEWHAEIRATLAGHLGRWAAQRYQHLPAFRTVTNGPNGALFFPETRHTLKGPFRSFWERHGGLPTFGYPISEEFTQTNTIDGKAYVVQYFERTRFEFHPEQSPDYHVMLGHLGREYLASHPAPTQATQPVASADEAWEHVRPVHIRIPRIGVDTDIVEMGFSAEQWDVPRDSAAHYWPISAFPRTKGNIIISGHVGYKGMIFHTLPDIREGDEIFLTTNNHTDRYIVRKKLLLLPQDTWVMDPTPSETLTLITCVPIGVYSHRLVVQAQPIGSGENNYDTTN